MPTVLEFLTTFHVDGVAVGAALVAAVLYALGIRAVVRRGERWGVLRPLGFYVLGLGSFLWIQCGFLGTWSHDLRWAFTTRVAFLLFMTPLFMSLGAPITLARRALTARPLAALEAALRSRPIRLAGNAIFAPLITLAGFSLFLTRFAAPLRLDSGWAIAITLLVPLGGLVMALPIIEDSGSRTSLFIMYEFMLALVEFMLDAIPGIFLRLHNSIMDGAAAITQTAWGAALPSWFPNPLHDQHLSGDFLWFIAEVADLPVLIALFARWAHVDRKDAKEVDDLSDEEYEAAVRAHLGQAPR